MVSNDYRELILFLMIYQTPNNIQHSIFNPTLLGKSHSSTHLVSWMIKNWFVCAEKWGEAEVTRDSSCWPPGVPWFTVHNPDHSGGDSGRSRSLKASDPSMGRPGAWPEWVWRGSAVGGPGPASHYRVWPGTDMELRPDMELTATERVVTAGAGGPSGPRVHGGQYRLRCTLCR